MEFKRIGNCLLSNIFQNNLLKLFQVFHYCIANSAIANLCMGFQTLGQRGKAAK